MLFISQTLPYSYCACIGNTPKIVALVIGKTKLVSFSLFKMLPPPPPPYFISLLYLDLYVLGDDALIS